MNPFIYYTFLSQKRTVNKPLNSLERLLLKNCYFIIYDLDDNIIAYLDSVKDVLDYTGITIYNLYNRIKKGYCYYQYNGTYRKIYRFYDT